MQQINHVFTQGPAVDPETNEEVPVMNPKTGESMLEGFSMSDSDESFFEILTFELVPRFSREH